MKKLIAAVLLLVMALSLCGCGKKAEAIPASVRMAAAEKAAAEAEKAAPAELSAKEEEAKPAAIPMTGSVVPQSSAAAQEAEALFNSGDYKAAFEKASAADAGDPAVAALLGKSYYLGLGTDVNQAKAMSYLETAAKGGYPSCAYLLADATDYGKGTRMDKDEAARRYIKFVAIADEVDPASSDYGMSMCYLSECFAKGHGVEKKHELALDAANKASAAANLTPFELMSLAAFYDGPAPNHVSNAADATGEYAVETARKVDAAKAEELYKRAVPGLQKLADAGNLAAVKLMGDLYLDGKGGLPQDYAKAMETYMIAADEDYADAQAQIGYMYQNALGVPADYAKAMEWNNRAAQQGNAQGQAQIGYLYQNGLGVTQNLDEAGRWYTRAKEGGSDWAAAMLEQTEATNPHASFEAHA